MGLKVQDLENEGLNYIFQLLLFCGLSLVLHFQRFTLYVYIASEVFLNSALRQR